VVGVQFHPESALTEYGYAMLDYFLHGESPGRATLSNRADGARNVGDRATKASRPTRTPAAAFVPPSVDLVR
jgi:hypothetical protein